MSRGQIARWALEETGAAYETVIVEYGAEMKGQAYLAINPMGKVPAIQHEGRVVTEAAAICAYLAEAFPEVGLAPTAEERAAYWRWLFFAAGPLEYAITFKFMGPEVGECTPQGSASVLTTMRSAPSMPCSSGTTTSAAAVSPWPTSMSAVISNGASNSRPCRSARPSRPMRRGLRRARPASARGKSTTP